MKNLALITEYNPFHNGHLYHIFKSLHSQNSDYDNVIAIMSGNFVQRGYPSVANKFLRTKMALQNGVDMCIELPLYFATASAEYFAEGAVKILNATNIVDSICFGSENGSLNELVTLSEKLLDEDFNTELKLALKNGDSFPKTRHKLLMPENNDTLHLPNNILALEYLKALKKTNSSISPFTIKRQKSPYHSLQIFNKFASATAIRNTISTSTLKASKNSMPLDVYKLLTEEINSIGYCKIDNFSHALQYALTTTKKEDLMKILDISEGLENRILDKASQNFHYQDIIDAVKTKRYTRTRISRALLHILLKITKSDFETYLQNPPYIRVLGFRKEKSFLLSELVKKSSIPVVTNLKNYKNILDINGINMLEKEITSTQIFWQGYDSYKDLQSLNQFKNEFSQEMIIL